MIESGDICKLFGVGCLFFEFCFLFHLDFKVFAHTLKKEKRSVLNVHPTPNLRFLFALSIIGEDTHALYIYLSFLFNLLCRDNISGLGAHSLIISVLQCLSAV